MPTFFLTFALFMLGACAVVSSPVPSTLGKRAFLFIVGVALWAGAIIFVRSNEEVILNFLSSDWSLSGHLANQVGASFVLFGFGWYVFVASSVRTERKRTTRFEQAWYNAEDTVDVMKVFRPWPGLLIWVPVVALLAVVWLVPAHLAGVDLEPTATLTMTIPATNTPTAMPTNTPTTTNTPTATATTIPTNTPTTTPTAMPEPTNTPTQTPDPSKPALACNGTWLHEEPVAVGNIRTLFELCADGYRFAAHEVDIGWDPIPTESMTMMPGGGARLEFQMNNGELLVNGQPFAEWLASQGGR